MHIIPVLNLLPTAVPQPDTTTPAVKSSFGICGTVAKTPLTGCSGVDGDSLTSTTAGVPCTPKCSTNWIAFDIAATIADTMSRCVEASWSMNHYATTNVTCVGAKWVPAWVNASMTYAAVKVLFEE
jgi:hypothetical protein